MSTDVVQKAEVHPLVAEKVSRIAAQQLVHEAARMLSPYDDVEPKPISEVMAWLDKAKEVLATINGSAATDAPESSEATEMEASAPTAKSDSSDTVNAIFTPATLPAWSLEQLDAIAKTDDADDAAARIATLRFVHTMAKVHFSGEDAGRDLEVPIHSAHVGCARKVEPSEPEPNPATTETEKRDFAWPPDLGEHTEIEEEDRW